MNPHAALLIAISTAAAFFGGWFLRAGWEERKRILAAAAQPRHEPRLCSCRPSCDYVRSGTADSYDGR